MNYAALKPIDVANGPGIRVSLYVSGCEHRCPGCFNPEAWHFEYGEPYTDETAQAVLDAIQPAYVSGFTLLGGEPLHPRNCAKVLELVRKVKAAYPQKSIWCYTGYDFVKELLPRAQQDEVLRELLESMAVLVDGRFVDAKKDLTLRFRGSANQRILDLPKSLAESKAVLADVL